MKSEHNAYRTKVKAMMQDKDAIISKLREQVKATAGPASPAAATPPEPSPAAETPQRDVNNEVAKYKKGMEESERAQNLLKEQVRALKEELSSYERANKRDQTPQEYLKSIVIAYME